MTKVRPSKIVVEPPRVYEPPAFTDPHQVTSAPYRREPYVRITFPDGRLQDAKARRWSPTHVLVLWQNDPDRPPHSAWVPAGWVQRITREESSWRDPYDFH